LNPTPEGIPAGDKMLNLYDYQHDAIAELREGFAKGYKAQVLVAPTGSGKTEMAIALMEAVRAKGKRAAMVLDRIVLCNQTSGRLDKYGIDHGVLQAQHWRFRPYEQIQVCSAQTLERMKEFPEIDLLIIDECHSTRTQTTEFIKANPKIKVVGLTATPFTKGLGKIYDNVVSTVTTKDLIKQEVLVPLRVFIAKEIDMAGAKTSYGEWTGKEVTARGKKVTGDIVAEWIEKTHAIFGRPRKTVVFAAGVDHGIDLSRKFQEQGYNFLCISYKDDGEYKADVIEDFSKPDTEIHGLIATDILTKGFDVPDVMIGISARPFTKSLSSHIQQLGRVTRSWPGGDKKFALWLDHSGNYMRFKDEWDDVFENGVDELDDGKEKAKQEPTEYEKEVSKCPKCHALWAKGSDTCYNCGFVREKANAVYSVNGVMEELSVKKKVYPIAVRQSFWSSMTWKMHNSGWSRGRAANTFRDKFGEWPEGLNDNLPRLPSLADDAFCRKNLYDYLNAIKKR
jgi:superfamily II DNA or RNA helicase